MWIEFWYRGLVIWDMAGAWGGRFGMRNGDTGLRTGDWMANVLSTMIQFCSDLLAMKHNYE